MTFLAPTVVGVKSPVNATSPTNISVTGVVGRTYVAVLGRYTATHDFDTVTDNGSNTWTRLRSVPVSGSTGRRAELWVCHPTNPFTTVTLTFVDISFATAAIIELIGGTGAVDVHNGLERASSTTPAAVNVTPTQANTLVIAGIQANPNATSAITPSAGWTPLAGATSEGPDLAWQYNPSVVVATGVSWTLGAASGSGHVIAAFIEAPPDSPFYLWDGTDETLLTIEGVWNGTTVDPVGFEVVHS